MNFCLPLLSKSYSILFLAHALALLKMYYIFQQHMVHANLLFIPIHRKTIQNGSRIVTPITRRVAVILTKIILHILFLHSVSHIFHYIFISLLAHSITHTYSVAACISITACFSIFALFLFPLIYFQKFGLTSSKMSFNSIRIIQGVTSANCLANFRTYT